MAQRIGWRREGSKRRFRYVDADGRKITGRGKARAHSRARNPLLREGGLDRAERADEAAGDRDRTRRAASSTSITTRNTARGRSRRSTTS